MSRPSAASAEQARGAGGGSYNRGARTTASPPTELVRAPRTRSRGHGVRRKVARRPREPRFQTPRRPSSSRRRAHRPGIPRRAGAPRRRSSAPTPGGDRASPATIPPGGGRNPPGRATASRSGPARAACRGSIAPSTGLAATRAALSRSASKFFGCGSYATTQPPCPTHREHSRHVADVGPRIEPRLSPGSASRHSASVTIRSNTPSTATCRPMLLRGEMRSRWPQGSVTSRQSASISDDGRKRRTS